MSKSHLILVAVLISCSSDDSHPDASAADTAITSATVQPAAADAVTAACDSAAARWQRIAGAELQRGDTVLRPDDFMKDYYGDDVVRGAVDTRYRGCFVTGEHAAGLSVSDREQLYWPRTAWPALWRITADGPDGQVQTYQRGWVRCQVSEEADGGYEEDDYVPDPFYRELALCWRHSRLIELGDTARPTGL